MAPESHRERSQAFLDEGDTAAEHGDLDEAVSHYRAAYYGLSRAERASYLGSMPIRKAIVAFERRIAQERDPALRRQLLEEQRLLLAEFLLEVRARDGAAEEIGKDVIAELEGIQRAIDEALEAEEPLPSTEPEPPSGTTEPDRPSSPGPEPQLERSTIVDFPPVEPPSPGPSKPRRDPLGLGLTIGGGAVLATGLAVGVGWWVVRSGARANVDGGGEPFAEGTQARADYLAQADEHARKYLVAGSVVAGLGLATTLAGVAHLVVHRRRSTTRDTALHVAPFSSLAATGLVFHGRF
jgi:hypothetical protein